MNDFKGKVWQKKIYDLWQNEAKKISGCYISNTATEEENPEGIHRVGLYAEHDKNIVLDGNGATLLVHGILTPLFFKGCKNITLKNFTVDYARPTMSELFVARREKEGYILRANEETLFEIEGNTLYFVGENVNGVPLWRYPYKGNEMLTMYTEKGKHTGFLRGNAGDSRPSIPTFFKVERIGERELYVELAEGKALPVGAVLQTRRIVREEVGSCFTDCENITLENVTCRAMHGLGMVFQNCKNVTVKNCDFTPKAGRTIASNADFFHFSACRGKILLDGVSASGAHDDFVNVHGTYLRVEEYSAESKSAVLRFCHEQSFGFTAFSKGDKVAFIT